MRFADIIGNNEATTALRSMADSGRIPHAMLIHGPEGIGKMIAARAFISYLNCENPRNGDSCGVCPSCRRIEAGNNPDIHYVYPVRKTSSPKRSTSTDYIEQWHRFLKESPYMDQATWLSLIEAENSQPAIYVDEAEAIAEAASMSAYADKYKIFLIWLPERMRPDTANKLLKLIEEPYEDTLFICVSNQPSLILPTISSRLRPVEMRPPGQDVIMNALLGRGVSQISARNASRLAEGSLQRAFSLLAQEGETEEFSGTFKDSMRLAYARKVGEMRRLSENLASMGREKNLRALDYFARLTRENFIANLSIPPLNIMTEDEEAFSQRFSPFIHSGNVEKIITEIGLARRDISRNANSKLVWFDFLLRLMLLLHVKPN